MDEKIKKLMDEIVDKIKVIAADYNATITFNKDYLMTFKFPPGTSQETIEEFYNNFKSISGVDAKPLQKMN